MPVLFDGIEQYRQQAPMKEHTAGIASHVLWSAGAPPLVGGLGVYQVWGGSPLVGAALHGRGLGAQIFTEVAPGKLRIFREQQFPI